jgi:hypothetical protein
MKKIIISFAALLLFMACEKKIEFKQEEVDPRIVVNSVFTQHDYMWVHLSESRNVLFEGELPAIENATPQLLDADGNVIEEFTYDWSGLYYCSTALLEPGSTYGLRVELDGFKTVTASSLFPKEITATIDSVAAPSDQLDLTLNFADDESQTNFYAVSMTYYGIYLDEMGEEEVYKAASFETNEYYVANGNPGINGEKFSREFLFTDETFNGQTIDFTGTVDRHEGDEPGSFYAIKLINLSEDLFKYKLSYRKYKDAQGNPFAEPVQVYSNITDGYGIFAGANEYVDTIWVE